MSGVGGVGGAGGGGAAGGAGAVSGTSAVGAGSSPVGDSPANSKVESKSQGSSNEGAGMYIQQTSNMSTHESVSLQQCNQTQEPQGIQGDMKKLIEMMMIMKLLEALTKGQG